MNDGRNIVSVTVASIGPSGLIYAIGATTHHEHGARIDEFMGRLPDDQVTDPYIKALYLPAIADVPPTHNTEDTLFAAFREFYERHKEGAIIITHQGYNHAGISLNRIFGGKCDDLHVVDICRIITEATTRTRTLWDYIEYSGIKMPDGCTRNHPRHAALAAAVVYFRLSRQFC